MSSPVLPPEQQPEQQQPVAVNIPGTDAANPNLTFSKDNKNTLIVYVSALLRTWETAILLFLSLLNKRPPPPPPQTDDVITLILIVSPFLREKGIFPSDKPGETKEQVNQFSNFIKMLLSFKKLLSADVNSKFALIPDKFVIILKFGEYIFKFDCSENEITISQLRNALVIITTEIKIKQDTLNKTATYIVSIKTSNDLAVKKYVSFNEQSSTLAQAGGAGNVNIKMPGSLLRNTELNITTSERIKESEPDITNFLTWVIKINGHDRSTPILFVSHSHTMSYFLKTVRSLNKPTNGSSSNESQFFSSTCKEAIKTNTWSMRFLFSGFSVTGFRHAFSCDNMYALLGNIKPLPTRLSASKSMYTNLALWGIMSTFIFITQESKSILDLTNPSPNTFSVLIGMVKQPKAMLTPDSLKLELTCGEKSNRFSQGDDGNLVTKQITVTSDLAPIPIQPSIIPKTEGQDLRIFLTTVGRCGTSSKMTVGEGRCIIIEYLGNKGFDLAQLRKVAIYIKKLPNANIRFFTDNTSNTYVCSEDFANKDTIKRIVDFLMYGLSQSVDHKQKCMLDTTQDTTQRKTHIDKYTDLLLLEINDAITTIFSKDDKSTQKYTKFFSAVTKDVVPAGGGKSRNGRNGKKKSHKKRRQFRKTLKQKHALRYKSAKKSRSRSRSRRTCFSRK